MRYDKVEIRLTEEEKKSLKIYAAKSGKTMSEVIRELCEQIFKSQEER